VSGDDMPAWMHDVIRAVPGITAHQLVGLHRPPRGGAPRAASVLVLFGEGVRGPELLLLERAADMRAHPGQVAFPGGSQDETDADAVAAALREAEEETGLDRNGVDIVGVLPALWLSATDFLVTPVIGWWRTQGEVHAVDPAETASVHVIAVADLLDPAHRGRVRHPSGYVGPAFQVGRVLVWGFTAIILAGLFRELGWERPWDPERYFELPAAVLAGSQRDLDRRRAAAGLATAADQRA
jgi:8-oxo-dGTP pyrophosphatase MutT (NUDIX family)